MQQTLGHLDVLLTWHLSEASLVMKEMNSETHSWTHSRASLAILPCVEGMDFFMMRATLAMGRKRSWKKEQAKLRRKNYRLFIITK